MNEKQHPAAEASSAHPSSRAPDHDGRFVLLTIDEACQQLRISRWTLYRLINRRALRTIKIGNRRLIPPDAIQELVRELQDQEASS